MLVRLLLTLLLAAFAVPAMATGCHDAGASRAATHHAMPSDDEPAPAPDQAAAHGCIGCIPPCDWLAPRLAAPMTPSGDEAVATDATLDLASATPPATPPPRG